MRYFLTRSKFLFLHCMLRSSKHSNIVWRETSIKHKKDNSSFSFSGKIIDKIKWFLAPFVSSIILLSCGDVTRIKRSRTFYKIDRVIFPSSSIKSINSSSNSASSSSPLRIKYYFIKVKQFDMTLWQLKSNSESEDSI